MRVLDKISIVLCVLGTSFTACDSGFEELNKDPNRIDEISQGSLLSPILYEMASYNYLRADDVTFDFMQVSLNHPSSGTDRAHYYMTETSGEGVWSIYYNWLTSVKEMYEASIKFKDPNSQAIALTLNSWLYANLTDAFGDVPMKEASRAEEGILTPVFDTQKEIYTRIISDLETANEMFITSQKLTYIGDLLYNANTETEGILKWKKFCNSLRMRCLLRISKRDSEMNVYAELNKMVNDSAKYPVFEKNADGAILALSGLAPQLPPISRPQDFTTGRAAGEFFIDNLVAMDDPRLPIWASKAKDLDGKNIGYKGIPSGSPITQTFNYTPSNLNQALAKAPLNIVLMTYAEVKFIMAELAYKNIISGDAKTYYEEGTKAAIEQWGGVVPANYFSNVNAAYNDTFERIMLQKYFALFFNDYQQWFEYKRTGLPVLPDNGGLLNNGKMPVRYQYPPKIKRMNSTNYQKAAENMGGDNINIRSWWEK